MTLGEERKLRNRSSCLPGHYTEIAINQNSKTDGTGNQINSPNRSKSLHSDEQRGSLRHSTWMERTFFALGERALRANLAIVPTMVRRLRDIWSTTIKHPTHDKKPTGVTENVLSLGKLCTELLGIAHKPGFSRASATIKCREVL